jgi:hypothetical protein
MESAFSRASHTGGLRFTPMLADMKRAGVKPSVPKKLPDANNFAQTICFGSSRSFNPDF